MRILVVSQYYYPENFRINDICEELVRRGHSVTVLTGLPHYPEGKVQKEYKLGRRRQKIVNGVVILCCFETVVNVSTCLGRGCIVNTCASVDQDCVLEEGVHVSVGAHIACSVRIGARTWVGIGACVSNNLSLCPDCMVGAGAAVERDITHPGTFVGVPAKGLA